MIFILIVGDFVQQLYGIDTVSFCSVFKQPLLILAFFQTALLIGQSINYAGNAIVDYNKRRKQQSNSGKMQTVNNPATRQRWRRR